MATVHYSADLTAGSLKVTESRVVAGLLLQDPTRDDWPALFAKQNVLHVRNPATATRIGRLLLKRLQPCGRDLWLLVHDGSLTTASQALLAAAIKHSMLLGDFMGLVVKEQYRGFAASLTPKLWEDFLADCRGRDPEMPVWNESTRRRLRSTVFQILAQAGYIGDTRSLKLQRVHLDPQVLSYLAKHDEKYVLKCMQVSE